MTHMIIQAYISVQLWWYGRPRLIGFCIGKFALHTANTRVRVNGRHHAREQTLPLTHPCMRTRALKLCGPSIFHYTLCPTLSNSVHHHHHQHLILIYQTQLLLVCPLQLTVHSIYQSIGNIFRWSCERWIGLLRQNDVVIASPSFTSQYIYINVKYIWTCVFHEYV